MVQFSNLILQLPLFRVRDTCDGLYLVFVVRP